MTLNFQSAFKKYKVRTDNVWTTNIPAMGLSVKASADDLSGVYSINYPNPEGFAKNIFTHFQTQEIWMAHTPTDTLYHVFTGQINAIDITGQKNVLQLKGRGLSGLLTDRKINDSWLEKRVDFILCDPTFGAFPLEFGTDVTTWNGFTDDFDRFDYWNSTRWGSQPAYCDIYNNTLDFEGDVGSTRHLENADESYIYGSLEFRLKVDAASNNVNFGFASDSTLAEAVYFKLTTTGVDSVCTSGGSTTTNSDIATPTQTDYNYYRVEWSSDEARFFVNGVLEDTITSDITSTASQFFIQMATTNSTATIDYLKLFTLTRKVDRFVARNKIMSDVVTELCNIGTETAAFSFWIDKDFDFNAKIKESADPTYGYGYKSTIYTDAEFSISEIKLNEEAKDLYNFVRITGGERLTEVSAPDWTESGKGDGTTTAFVLGFKANKPLTYVEVNSVQKVEDTDFSVTYGKEHTVVEFTAGGAPGDGHTINWRYDYYTPIIATAQNKTSQSSYGVTREYSKNDESIVDQDRANQLASALLAFFSDPRTVIKTTVPLNPRLFIGETVMVDAPYVKIDNTKYEIIELEHNIGRGAFSSTLTLANAEIDTNSEILREILQQLKEIRSRGETTSIVSEEYPLEETVACTEAMDLEKRWVCDSFILDHPADNGKLGMGQVLDDFESGVTTNWTGADFTESMSSTQYRVTANSMKLEYSGTGAKTTTSTQSFGDISSETGAASGTPVQGGLGIWVYLADAAQLTGVNIRIGSSASDYMEYDLALYGSTVGNVQRVGWNYFVAEMENPDASAGTPDWTDVDYCRLQLTVASGTELYVDYLTVSQSDAAAPNRIGLNGYGYRYMTTGDVELTLTG